MNKLHTQQCDPRELEKKREQEILSRIPHVTHTLREHDDDEKYKQTVGAIVVRQLDGGMIEVLLTKRNLGLFRHYWCLPGGGIESSESLEDAVIREVHEETGLGTQKGENEIELGFALHPFVCISETYPEHKHYAWVLMFEGVVDSEDSPLQADEFEITEVRWFPLEKARRMPLAFEHNRALDEYALCKGLATDLRDELLHEYDGLRAEINDLQAHRLQVLTLVLAAIGAILTIDGVSGADMATIMRVYPIFAFLLAMVWAQVDRNIGRIAEYIKHELESRLGGLRWESHLARPYSRDVSSFRRFLRSFRNVTVLSSAGIIVGTQAIAVGFVIFNAPPTSWQEWVGVLGIAIPAGIGVLFAISYRRWNIHA